MFTSSFFRRLFVPYLLLAWVAIGVVGFVAVAAVRSSYMDSARVGLGNQAVLVAQLLSPALREPLANASPSTAPSGTLEAQVKALAQRTGSRITLIADDGTVLADSDADAPRMVNHRYRPEVATAATAPDGFGSDIRRSDTIHEDLLYLARREQFDGRTLYVRLALRLAVLNEALQQLYVVIVLVALGAMAVSAGICFVFARRHAVPLLELTDFAAELAGGDLSRRYLGSARGELGTLASTLNLMAESLSRLLRQRTEDNDRLLTILASMNEGVIAADTQQHILLSNTAAGRFFGYDADAAKGKLLWEVVRNDAILRCAGEALRRNKRATIAVGPLNGRHLEVTACTFSGTGRPEGLILVAHDTTQSVQYQDLRKEFVANVSHELRTPLSIIKGFAETLRDGAMSDPVRGPQFLETIERHTNQLSNLVNDLLELSKLESMPGATRFSQVDVVLLVRRAGDMLLPAAQRKRHELLLNLPSQLPQVHANPDYLERAVTNLIDNAIKYTPEAGQIRVSAQQENGSVVIEVEDNGIGISQEDLPRIFERFYRVDRSRSRELGGTGLGLSIVKHVAQAHGGSIDVTSTPGKGTTFRLQVPLTRSLGDGR